MNLFTQSLMMMMTLAIATSGLGCSTAEPERKISSENAKLTSEQLENLGEIGIQNLKLAVLLNSGARALGQKPSTLLDANHIFNYYGPASMIIGVGSFAWGSVNVFADSISGGGALILDTIMGQKTFGNISFTPQRLNDFLINGGAISFVVGSGLAITKSIIGKDESPKEAESRTLEAINKEIKSVSSLYSRVYSLNSTQAVILENLIRNEYVLRSKNYKKGSNVTIEVTGLMLKNNLISESVARAFNEQTSKIVAQMDKEKTTVHLTREINYEKEMKIAKNGLRDLISELNQMTKTKNFPTELQRKSDQAVEESERLLKRIDG